MCHLHFQTQVPGPGTYGKGGIPTALVEEKNKQSISNVGMLDSGKSYKRQLPEVVCIYQMMAYHVILCTIRGPHPRTWGCHQTKIHKIRKTNVTFKPS